MKPGGNFCAQNESNKKAENKTHKPLTNSSHLLVDLFSWMLNVLLSPGSELAFLPYLFLSALCHLSVPKASQLWMTLLISVWSRDIFLLQLSKPFVFQPPASAKRFLFSLRLGELH